MNCFWDDNAFWNNVDDSISQSVLTRYAKWVFISKSHCALGLVLHILHFQPPKEDVHNSYLLEPKSKKFNWKDFQILGSKSFWQGAFEWPCPSHRSALSWKLKAFFAWISSKIPLEKHFYLIIKRYETKVESKVVVWSKRESTNLYYCRPVKVL